MYMYRAFDSLTHTCISANFLITPVFTVHVVLGVVLKLSVSPMEYVVCMYSCMRSIVL